MEAASEQLPTWALEAELLAHQVAPDFKLAGLVPYVMPTSVLHAIGHPFRHMDIDGAFSPTLDVELRDVIGERWKGRGPTVILNDAAEGYRDFPDDLVRLSIHEFAHAVASLRALRTPAPSGRQLAAWKADRAKQLSNFVGAYPSVVSYCGEQFGFHDLRFIRALCHMSFRAGQVNPQWETPLFWRIVPGLKGISYYVRAFEEEARCLDRVPLQVILNMEAPAKAADLWESDVAAFAREMKEFRQAGLDRPPSERTDARVTVAVGDNKEVPMTLNSLLEKLTGALKKRETDRLGDFAGLVKQIASGKEPKIADVERILLDTGKTPEDLAKAVQHRVRRLALREKLDKQPMAEKAKADAERKFEEAKAEFEKAEAAYAEKVAPLNFEVRNAIDMIQAAFDAKTELMQTCDDPALLASLADIAQQMKAVEAKRTETADRIDRNKRGIAATESRLERGHIVHPDNLEDARLAKERVAALREEEKQLHAEQQRLVEEEHRVRLRMLEP